MRRSAGRINRRRLLQGTAGAAGLAAFAAPGGARALSLPGSPGINQPVSLRAQATGEIEFAYYTWSPASIQYFKDMAAAFEASHPDTKLTLTLPPYDQYATKLKVLLATGDGPDIITTTELTLGLVKEGRLLDLTDRITADPVFFDPAVFVQGGWDLFKFGTDRYYGVYSGADTLLLYYNKTLFDSAGVDYPTAEWTWDDFATAAKALTIRDGDRVTQWGTALGSLDAYWGWANLVWMEGGDIVDNRPFYTNLTLNNEPVLSVLQFLHDLIHTDQVAPNLSQSTNLDDQGGFASGTVAMMVDGGWSIQGWKEITAFEWDIETLPQGSQGFIGEYWPGTPFEISAGSDNPDLAWEYVRWFSSSPEAQQLIADQLVQVPALLEIANSESFLGLPGLPGNAAAWVRSLDNSRPADTFHAKQQEMIDKVWTPNWEKFLNNSITPQEFAQTVEADGNAILNEA